MAITSMDGVVAALATSQRLNFSFPNMTTVAGNYYNLSFASAGSYGQISLPTAASSGGQAYTQGGTGGLGYPVWTAASGGNTSYIGKISASCIAQLGVFVYDLLWACSGFSGTVTTPQTITGFTALPTRAGGSGSEIWLVVYTALGASAPNVTVSYTNQNGTSGRTTQTMNASSLNLAGRCVPLILQAGDTGVQSIQSVILYASSGTAGNFGLMIVNRIASVGSFGTYTPNAGYDFATLGLPVIYDSSVLFFTVIASASSSGIILGDITVVQG